jgi:hypothetical protein
MKKLDILCVTYKQGVRLETFSLLHVGANVPRFLVIHDGPDDAFEQVRQRYGSAHPDLLQFLATPDRYNDYGHSLREIGIGQLQHVGKVHQTLMVHN